MKDKKLVSRDYYILIVKNKWEINFLKKKEIASINY